MARGYGRNKTAIQAGFKSTQEVDVTEHIHHEVPNKHGNVAYRPGGLGGQQTALKKKSVLPGKQEGQSHKATPDPSEEESVVYRAHPVLLWVGAGPAAGSLVPGSTTY